MNLGTDSTPTGATPEGRRLSRGELSFWEIYTAYSQAVQSFFSKKGIPPEECKDLTQETFLRVYKSMDTIRQHDTVSSFVFTTATNLFRNKIRDRKTHKRDGHEVSLDDTFNNLPDDTGDRLPAALGSILRAEELRMLRAALQELSPQMRRCVELRLYQELRYREIAVILDVSIETVKAHLHHVKQQLKSRLGDYFNRLDLEDRDARRRS